MEKVLQWDFSNHSNIQASGHKSIVSSNEILKYFFAHPVKCEHSGANAAALTKTKLIRQVGNNQSMQHLNVASVMEEPLVRPFMIMAVSKVN